MLKNLKKFQIVMIDEKRTFLQYEGVEKKGPRPFLVVRTDLYGNFFIACPLTDIETANKWPKEKRKSYLETNVMKGQSFIKMNFPVIMPKSYIDDGIVVLIDRHLNKSQRSIALKLLKESYDD